MEIAGMSHVQQFSYLTPLIAGGLAGLSVDVTLYPIDTIKTRLQSEQGFYKAGGFRGVYRGLGAVVAGSMPTAALFFMSYELVKGAARPLVPAEYTPAVHMLAASVGEVMACLVRVPTEIVKQRKQTLSSSARRGGLRMLLAAYHEEGLCRGVYRGYLSTVIRDMPFSLIQMPIWELLKSKVRERNGGHISGIQGAFCGSIAGGISAALTTPLDVAKTRIMLTEDYTNANKLKITPVLRQIYSENGFKGLFAGLTPRVVAFTIGGFVFFGAYDYVKLACERVL